MWPTGIRKMLGSRPRPGGDTALMGDTLAYQTCVALGPSDRRVLAHQWRLWYETQTLMLSIPGLYAHIVAVGEYPAASLPRQHYPFLTDNITMPLVAAWMIQHGIATSGPHIEALEAFARSRRNMRNNIDDLSNVGWADEPRSMAHAMAADPSSIPAWADLHHAPSVRDPDAVQNPGNAVPGPSGLSVSLHAPAMEVDARGEEEEDAHPSPPTSPAPEM
ncbi:hypothetical protein B0H13DRAFT_2383420 [Mycena leptocephala]|nr:hypothetical protein B0H13DRAFT_2383420 [Mycena leptocephala]